jgi:hypothetical protein
VTFYPRVPSFARGLGCAVILELGVIAPVRVIPKQSDQQGCQTVLNKYRTYQESEIAHATNRYRFIRWRWWYELGF